MTNFVELMAFKHGEAKTPITINVNCIKAVFTEGGNFSKIIVSDDNSQSKILIQKGVGERHDMNK